MLRRASEDERRVKLRMMHSYRLSAGVGLGINWHQELLGDHSRL